MEYKSRFRVEKAPPLPLESVRTKWAELRRAFKEMSITQSIFVATANTQSVERLYGTLYYMMRVHFPSQFILRSESENHGVRIWKIDPRRKVKTAQRENMQTEDKRHA